MADIKRTFVFRLIAVCINLTGIFLLILYFKYIYTE